MPNLEKLRIAEAERLAREAQARRQWEHEDLKRLKENIRNDDLLPDEWLEEAQEYMRDKAGGS